MMKLNNVGRTKYSDFFKENGNAYAANVKNREIFTKKKLLLTGLVRLQFFLIFFNACFVCRNKAIQTDQILTFKNVL